MQVAYNWKERRCVVVLKTQASGGMIQHPDPNQNPHQNQDVHAGGLPRFNDVLIGGCPGSKVPFRRPSAPSAPNQTPSKILLAKDYGYPVAFVVAVVVIGFSCAANLEEGRKK